MNKSSIYRSFSILCFVFLLFCWKPTEAKKASSVNERLDKIFEDARGEFFTTVNKILERHILRSQLSEKDLSRIKGGQNQIPYLFERIMNIAYQKDQHIFSKWIQLGDEESMGKFRKNFIALAKDYAARFVGSLFRKHPGYEFAMMLRHNQGKSTLDLVLQTLGYNAKSELPDYPQEKWFTNKIDDEYFSQWGIDAVNARKCWPITKGAGVVVAVVDSGIDLYNKIFKEKIVSGFNFLQRTTPPWSDENPPVFDYGLHGTGVSSALLAIAPECKIMPVRTGDADTMNDPPYDYWLTELGAAGIYYAVNHGAHIISKSSALRAAEPVVAEAVRYAYRHNVPICSSAGNMPRPHLGLRPEDILYKAFNKQVLLIGGVERRDGNIQPWSYSVPGPYVDVAAPSKEVFVLVPTYMEKVKNSYVAGTSLAAPIAAGVVALMRSIGPPTEGLLKKPGAYCRLIARCLKETARLDVLGMAERNEAVGHGLIDAHSAAQMARQLIKEKN